MSGDASRRPNENLLCLLHFGMGQAGFPSKIIFAKRKRLT
jgi:hypothetical protein